MHTEIVSCNAGFRQLEVDWNHLSENSPLHRHEWYMAWWKAFGETHQLSLIVVRHDGRVVAIAPWYICNDPIKGRLVRFLGSGKACTDYQRILVHPGAERQAIPQIADCLESSDNAPTIFRGVDSLEMEAVTADEPTINRLAIELQQKGFSVRRESIESSWILTLPGDWTDFLGSVPRYMRRKLTKSQQRLCNLPGLVVHESHDEITFRRMWPTFVALHQQRMLEVDGRDGCFATTAFTSFLFDAGCRLSTQGIARFYWAELDGIPFVIQLHLRGAHTTFSYQTGFHPDFAHLEPGYLLYTYIVRSLVEQSSMARLDFLRGNEPYKAQWGADAVPLSTVHCVAPRMVSRMRQQVYAAGRKLKHWIADASGA